VEVVRVRNHHDHMKRSYLQKKKLSRSTQEKSGEGVKREKINHPERKICC